MSLLKPKFNYQTLSRNTENGKRLYQCPDGRRVVSVTSILDRTKPPEKVQALAEWRKRVGHEAAQKITTDAANRGSLMHKYLEDHVIEGEIKDLGPDPNSDQSYVMAQTIINQGLVNVNEIWGVEIPLYYPELYAGTADGLGLHCNEESIIDYKQTNKPKRIEWIDDYMLQLCAYALAHNKIHGTNIRKGVVLMCVKPNEIEPGKWSTPEYQEFILHPDKFDYWESKWWDRVETFYRKY